MTKGRVYWLTGLSNAGKTTIGTSLYYKLKKNSESVIILDGDIMKDITSEMSTDQYSYEGRLKRAKRYSYLSKLLSDQGMTVIVCTISMYDQIREWNRKNIKGYIEVFIDADKDILIKRDKRGLASFPIEGLELPKEPDAIIRNNGDIPIRKLVERIEKIEPRDEEDYDRDKEYWNTFYLGKGEGLSEPSQFAKDIIGGMEKGKHILELGCGNGRDSLFFLSNGFRVTGVDASDIAVEKLNNITNENDQALFVCDNFVKCRSLYQLKYDYVYSRFTLHAIDEAQEDELIDNVYEALDAGGKFFIEARTIKDSIYGFGEPVERNAFIYNGHYRRFIDVNEFEKKLESKGFSIEYLEERKGFSVTDNSDPILMRCIANIV